MTVEASAAPEGGFYYAPGLFPNPTVHRAARPSAAHWLVVGCHHSFARTLLVC